MGLTTVQRDCAACDSLDTVNTIFCNHREGGRTPASPLIRHRKMVCRGSGKVKTGTKIPH